MNGLERRRLGFRIKASVVLECTGPVDPVFARERRVQRSPEAVTRRVLTDQTHYPVERALKGLPVHTTQ